MPLTITLAPEYGYCVAAFFGTICCNFYKVVTVVKARKLYDVQYPNLYAPHDHKNKKEFDCAQRQHQQGKKGPTHGYAKKSHQALAQLCS